MSNFTPPPGYPYGLKDPFPHTTLNKVIEAVVHAPNYEEGSSHQPTGDIVISGSAGHGLTFTNSCPISGSVDVSGGMTISASSGIVAIGAGVTIERHGPERRLGPQARTVYRPAVSLPGNVNADITVAADRYMIGNESSGVPIVYTVRHTAPFVPIDGQRIYITKIFPGASPLNVQSFVREDGYVLFKFFNDRQQGYGTFEFIDGLWRAVYGDSWSDADNPGFYP